MSKFGHIKKQLAFDGNSTADYPLIELEGEYVLVVKPALDCNKGLINAIMRKARAGGPKRAKAQTADDLRRIRDEERELYSEHVVCGFKNILDSKGQEVEYCQEDALELLQALPDPAFDALRGFCTNYSNFIDNNIEPEELGKN